jgi:ABC-type sugar transport system substrate-binding protein
MEPILNFTTIAYCSNGDLDAMLQNIEIFADQGVDGFIINIDAATSARIKEVLDTTGVPYIAMLNSVRDDNGSAIVPVVGLEGFEGGEKVVQWLFDNYSNYWGDIDPSRIGLLNYTFSPNIDFVDRHDGGLARFQQLIPNNAGVFSVDGVSGGLNEQAGFDLAAATLAANPEVEYWFISACLELYAQGATRAVESLGMEDRVLITTIASDILTAAWDAGYEGAWVSCLAISNYQWTVPAICGLISLINGTSTWETLWAYRRLPTDRYTFFAVELEIVTKDTYRAFFERIRNEAGLG